eukprot:7014392-Alexandrium_andersonii.AAC.1
MAQDLRRAAGSVDWGRARDLALGCLRDFPGRAGAGGQVFAPGPIPEVRSPAPRGPRSWRSCRQGVVLRRPGPA